jgi:hypothetical protein
MSIFLNHEFNTLFRRALFYAKESWCVVFFYDCGELDYIDHFVRPDGAILDVWPDGGVDQSECQGIVGSWRSCGDLARMKAWIAKPLNDVL